MNLNIMHEHLSKLKIIVYKKLNAERSKIPGNSRGNFSKDIFLGIPEREFPVALHITFERNLSGQFSPLTALLKSVPVP